MPTTTFDIGTGAGSGRTAPVFANSKKPLKIVTGTFDFDTSYPTGGETISTIFDKFATVHGIKFENKGGRFFEVDYTNKTVKAMQFDYPNAAAGAAIEVPNTTNLSTTTGVRFIAWGLPGASATS